MEQERVDLSGTVGMGGPSGDSTVAHLPLPRPAISRLEPAPDQGGPASAQAHLIALSSVARDWAHFGLRTPPRSRPGCHDDAVLPAAGSLWVPQSPSPGFWGCGRRAAGAPLGPGWRGDTTLGQRRRGWGWGVLRTHREHLRYQNLRHITENPAPGDLCLIPTALLRRFDLGWRGAVVNPSQVIILSPGFTQTMMTTFLPHLSATAIVPPSLSVSGKWVPHGRRGVQA